MSEQDNRDTPFSNRRKDDLYVTMSETFMRELKYNRRLSYFRTGIFAFILVTVFLTNDNINPFKSNSLIPKDSSYVSMVRLQGVIKPSSQFSVEAVEQSLIAAFADEKAIGVLLLINSTGGTPVQSLLLHDLISDLKKIYKKPVMVYAEDSVASGAYMVAMASDSIFATESTIGGSIGVIQRSWGIPGLMEKLGVESRTYFSGNSKNRSSPFEAVSPEDIQKSVETTGLIHKNFINLVKKSRGEKITLPDAEVFNGDYWVGSQLVDLGLIDGVMTLNEALSKTFSTSYRKDYTENNPVPSINKIFSSLSHVIESVADFTL